MVLGFYILLNVIVLVSFFCLRKQMHILELLVCWLLATYIFQNFSALGVMNFKTIETPDTLSEACAVFINRIILFPVCIVAFLNVYLSRTTFLRKLGVFVLFYCLLAGLEALGHLIGTFVHINWHIWWSMAFWFLFMLGLLGVMKLFSKILWRGVEDL